MCLAIYKPKGVEIARKYLENGFHNNDDGAGFGVAVKGRVKVFKGFFDFKSFWEAYRPYANKQAIIHFRLATHGKTNKDNCHPYPILDNKYAVVHNGVLDIAQTDRDMSDTYHFAEGVIAPLLKRVVMTDPALVFLMEQAIGSRNKVIVLGGNGDFKIYNEDQGSWHKGAWFSNRCYDYRKHQYASSSVYGEGGLPGHYRHGSCADVVEENDSKITVTGTSTTYRGEGRAKRAQRRGIGLSGYRVVDRDGEIWTYMQDPISGMYCKTRIVGRDKGLAPVREVWNFQGKLLRLEAVGKSCLDKLEQLTLEDRRHGHEDEGIADWNPQRNDWNEEEAEAAAEAQNEIARDMQRDLDKIQEEESKKKSGK